MLLRWIFAVLSKRNPTTKSKAVHTKTTQVGNGRESAIKEDGMRDDLNRFHHCLWFTNYILDQRFITYSD